MPRKKRSSRILSKAEGRAAGLQSIDEDLDLGNGLTLERYTAAVNKVRQKIIAYNETLSLMDRAANDVETAEKELASLSELMLLGVATRFGKDSYEYEMAGGVRKSERKRPTRRAATA